MRVSVWEETDLRAGVLIRPDEVSTVPLLKSVILFLSGLAILLGWQRRAGVTAESGLEEWALTI